MNKALVALEISTAVATLFSAGFVGWQAMLLRQTLDAPYLANLQNRQIDACSQYSKAFGSFTSGRTLGERSEMLQWLGVQDDELKDYYVIPRAFGSEDTDTFTPLIGAINELAFFAADEVDELALSMVGLVNRLRITEWQHTLIWKSARGDDVDETKGGVPPWENFFPNTTVEQSARLKKLGDTWTTTLSKIEDLHSSVTSACEEMLIGGVHRS